MGCPVPVPKADGSTYGYVVTPWLCVVYKVTINQVVVPKADGSTRLCGDSMAMWCLKVTINQVVVPKASTQLCGDSKVRLLLTKLLFPK